MTVDAGHCLIRLRLGVLIVPQEVWYFSSREVWYFSNREVWVFSMLALAQRNGPCSLTTCHADVRLDRIEREGFVRDWGKSTVSAVTNDEGDRTV